MRALSFGGTGINGRTGVRRLYATSINRFKLTSKAPSGLPLRHGRNVDLSVAPSGPYSGLQSGNIVIGFLSNMVA